uniref:Uncharacterized protein n=1 Tax=Rhizophora mucronata TaxID=61149 RepID=A0A2P2NYV1_RHIMU
MPFQKKSNYSFFIATMIPEWPLYIPSCQSRINYYLKAILLPMTNLHFQRSWSTYQV